MKEVIYMVSIEQSNKYFKQDYSGKIKIDPKLKEELKKVMANVLFRSLLEEDKISKKELNKLLYKISQV